MRLIDRVESKLHKRALPVPMVDQWQSGVAYSRDEWSNPDYGNYLATSNDVYSCAWLRAKNLAKLPIQVFDRSGEETLQGPLVDLLARPNPHWTRQRLIAFVELCLSIWGEAAILLDKGQTGRPSTRPREMWPCKPTSLKAIPHPTDFISGYVYQPPGGAQPIPLRADEVIFIQYPNPNDVYAGLAPMAAVRLAADVASESMKANRALFSQGMMAGGFIMPPDAMSHYTPEQAKELEDLIGKRFSGQRNAHRWQVLRYFLSLKEMNVTPKDAEWIAGANLTFRQVCRGMGVPPPLVGDAEYATLANLTIYERALWEHTLSFETEYVGAELTRQLAPSFGPVSIGFDLGEVVALQEDEQIKWSREREQIDLGAMTINEWRALQGLDDVPWGDSWWAPLTKAPVTDSEQPTAVVASASFRRALTRRPDKLTEIEDRFRDSLEAVTARLKDAVLQQLRQGERSIEGSSDEPFDRARWQERTRQACAASALAAALWIAQHEAEALGLSPQQIAKLLESKSLLAAVERLTQQFAQEVTETTWTTVRDAIREGARLGETLDEISARVAHIMDVRISDARRSATTEITRASTSGQLAAFTEAKVGGKRWVTMADGAVRDSHVPLHGVEIGLTEMFSVGAGRGPGPGQTGDPAEDINCRCILQPVQQRSANGKVAGPALIALRDALEVH